MLEVFYNYLLFLFLIFVLKILFTYFILTTTYYNGETNIFDIFYRYDRHCFLKRIFLF